MKAGSKAKAKVHMAVGQNQWFHFGGGAPILETILVGIGMFAGGKGFLPVATSPPSKLKSPPQLAHAVCRISGGTPRALAAR